MQEEVTLMGARRLRVVVAGLGRLGVQLAHVANVSPGVELAGIVSARGRTAVAEAGLAVEVTDLEAALADPEVDTILHGGHGHAPDIARLFEQSAAAGTDFVTSAALSFPAVDLGSAETERLDALARERGARLLSTGLNPGFLLDVLPGACVAIAPGWSRIQVTRSVDSAKWGAAALEELGLGGPAEALEASAPMSLVPSLRILGEMLAVDVASESEERAAYVAEADLAAGTAVIAQGTAAGFDHRARAVSADGREIEVRWQAAIGLRQYDPDALLGVRMDLNGDNPLTLQMTGRFADDPYPATAARMVHSAVAMRDLAPGLLTADVVPFGRRPRT
jgi:4-hydroxy-tetrahydrodipicolinate reductase